MSKSRTIAWVLWVVVSIFYAYQYVLRVMPNIMLSDIMERFAIDASLFGQFSGVYYIGYSLMHLPLGILFDRYGPKKIMSSCILLTVIGLVPLVFAKHWAYPVMGRFLIGIGSSAAILGVFKVVRMCFEEKQFARMLSLAVTIGLIGAIYGGGPVSHLCQKFGYESIIYLFTAVGVFLAVTTYFIIPELKNKPDTSILSNVKEVLTNGRVLLCCAFAGLMVGPLEGFADVWGTAFLKNALGFESSIAAKLPSMIFIGMCFGAPLLSFVAERVGNYLVSIIGTAIIMAAAFTLLLTTNPGTFNISVNFILIGVCCAYQILAIYKASTYVREEVAGLTTAMANMIIMVFGYGFHTAMGTIINSLGGPTSAKALSWGVAVIPATIGLAALGFAGLLIQEQRAKMLIPK